MSPALEPAPVTATDDTTSNSSGTSQQSAGMVYGGTPQDNAHGQQVANNDSQNSMNNATGGGRRTRRHRPAKSKKGKKCKKSKKSKRRGHKSSRRKSTRHSSRRVRGRKGRKGMKSKKRMRGGGGSPCGAGFVLAEVPTPMYPDRGGGDQTVAAQTSLAQTNGMNMGAQSALDSNVPEPQS